jgi:triosephosphate isomerase
MRPLIAGNWKMHGLTPQLDEIKAIAASVAATPPHADVLICVPPTLVFRAAQAAEGRIAIGGEDCSAERAGAFTGDVDADMLKDAGATAVILGHSERRRIHHETNALVAAKAAAAWASGLSTPWRCAAPSWRQACPTFRPATKRPSPMNRYGQSAPA